MRKLFEFIEYILFIAAICVITAGVSGLYLKIFKMNPPVTKLAIEMPVMLGMALVLIIRLRETAFGMMSMMPFVILGLLMVMSFYWSQFRVDTLKEALPSLLNILYLGYAAWRYDWKQLINGIWIAMFGMVMLSLALFVGAPDIARMSDVHAGTMSGIWIEKNAAGQIGTFGAIVALARLAINPKTFITSGVSFLFFTLFLLLTTSKTALVAYLFGCAGFAWVFLMRRFLPVSLATLWASIFVGFFSVIWVRGNMETVFGLLGRSSTFTGRADVWKAVQVSLERRPLLGHGYSAYWNEEQYMGKTIALVMEDLKYYPNHSHNSFVEMGLNLGMVGVTILAVAIILTVIASFWKIRASHGAYFAIPFLLAALIAGSFESVLAYPANFAGAMIVLVCAKMMRPVQYSEGQATLLNTMRRLGRHVVNDRPSIEPIVPEPVPMPSMTPYQPVEYIPAASARKRARPGRFEIRRPAVIDRTVAYNAAPTEYIHARDILELDQPVSTGNTAAFSKYDHYQAEHKPADLPPRMARIRDALTACREVLVDPLRGVRSRPVHFERYPENSGKAYLNRIWPDRYPATYRAD